MKFFFFLNRKVKLSNYVTKHNKLQLTHFNNSLNIDFYFFKNVKNYMSLSNNSIYFFKLLLTFFNVFYNFIKNSKTLKNNPYSYFYEISSILRNNMYLNNPVYFNSWFMSYFNFIFHLKNKKLKNNSIETKLTLLNTKKRNLYFFKIIKYYYLSKKNQKFKNFFSDILMDSYLNFKNSKIYNNKIYIYKFFLGN